MVLLLVLVVCGALICDGRSYSMRRPSETADAQINRTSPPAPSLRHLVQNRYPHQAGGAATAASASRTSATSPSPSGTRAPRAAASPAGTSSRAGPRARTGSNVDPRLNDDAPLVPPRARSGGARAHRERPGDDGGGRPLLAGAISFDMPGLGLDAKGDDMIS